MKQGAEEWEVFLRDDDTSADITDKGNRPTSEASVLALDPHIGEQEGKTESCSTMLRPRPAKILLLCELPYTVEYHLSLSLAIRVTFSPSTCTAAVLFISDCSNKTAVRPIFGNTMAYQRFRERENKYTILDV